MRASGSLLEAFEQVIGALDASSLDYALIGALARGVWGRPRSTSDIDFEVALDPAGHQALVACLTAVGVEEESSLGPETAESSVPDNLTFRTNGGIRIDVLVTKTDFQVQALKRRVRCEVLGTQAWVVTLEDLLVYKLIASRSQDLADIEALLDGLSDPEDLDWEHVESWARAWDRYALFARFETLFRTPT